MKHETIAILALGIGTIPAGSHHGLGATDKYIGHFVWMIFHDAFEYFLGVKSE